MAQRRPPDTAAQFEMIRIVLVEPSEVMGIGLREALDGEPDMQVVAEVRSADDALAVAEARAPDVIVLDVELNEPSTSAATHRLVQEAPNPGSWCSAARMTTRASSKRSRSVPWATCRPSRSRANSWP